jgi:hypothetical protein
MATIPLTHIGPANVGLEVDGLKVDGLDVDSPNNPSVPASANDPSGTSSFDEQKAHLLIRHQLLGKQLEGAKPGGNLSERSARRLIYNEYGIIHYGCSCAMFVLI